MSGYVPDKDKKELCLKSGNLCALPNCPVPLVVDFPGEKSNSVIAQIAHIRGENLGASRYDPNYPENKRNLYANLILVCPTCHKLIDDQEHIYTVEYLLETKVKHEKLVISRYKDDIPNVTFAELADVMNYISSAVQPKQHSLIVIPPKEKIDKNNLSSEIEGLILMGLTKASLIKEYINSSLDIEFATKLVNGFVHEYKRLKHVEDLEGDDLFLSLLDFASQGKTTITGKAAGLTVLSYLFEKCEVFEK